MIEKWLFPTVFVFLIGVVLFVGTHFLRRQLVHDKIRREAQALSDIAPLPIGETKTLEILPLYEAAARDGEKGFGTSYLIRADRTVILFDLGNNPAAESPSPLERNMARLGVPLDDIHLLVISHCHPDHVGGRNWWDKKTFSLTGASQPALGVLPIYAPETMSYPGSNPVVAEMPTRLAAGVATTGSFSFFDPLPVWRIIPSGSEQGLAVHIAGRGIVLITGCGHMGLRALLQRAETVFNAPVVGIVGGLHCGGAGPDTLRPDIRMLQDRHPIVVALSSHDSGPAALDAYARAFPASFRAVRVGERIRVP